MQIEYEQRHGDGENTIAQSRETLFVMTGDAAV
jgi:hypothetical protein